jgi:broad specificity polyphosphatase/5'/3'-nucleotidase SurE
MFHKSGVWVDWMPMLSQNRANYLPRPTAGRRGRSDGRSQRKKRFLGYRHEEQTGLYYAGDYNLRGRTPNADVDVCFNGNIAVSKVHFDCHALNAKTAFAGRRR